MRRPPAAARSPGRLVLVGAALLLATLLVLTAVLQPGREDLGQQAATGATGVEGYERRELPGARSYFLSPRPAVTTGAAVPLVVVLHGRSSSPALFLESTGLAEALAGQAVVAVGVTDPGLDRASWAAGECCTPATEAGVDDLAYLGALVADARSVRGGPAAGADGPVYVVGFSNGAMLGYRAACERPGLLDGLVAVGGQRAVDACEPEPIPVLEIHGGDDTSVPAEGLDFSELLGVALRSTEASLAPLLEAAGCDRWDEPTELAPEVETTSARGCSHPVEAVLVREAGHVWPRTEAFDATAYTLEWIQRRAQRSDAASSAAQ